MRCWPNAGARVPRLPEYGLVRAVRGWQRGRGRPGRMPPPPIKAAAKGGKRKKAPPPRKKGPPGPSPTAKRGGGPPPPPKRGPPAPPVPTSVVSAARDNDAHLATQDCFHPLLLRLSS